MVDGLNSTTYSPSELIAGEFPRETRLGLITGAAALLAGTLLGRTVTGGAIVSGAKAGNTGNGVLSGVAVAAGHKPGIYTATCIEPGANVGTFRVEDPQGNFVGTAVVAVAFSNQIAFTIGDGATDFVAGDGFTFTVAAGTEKFLPSVAAAVDGSEVPCAVLVDALDVTAGDKQGGIYMTGEFNAAVVVFGAGHTAASTKWDLSQKNIYLKDVA